MTTPSGHMEVSGPSGRPLEWTMIGRPHYNEVVSGDAWALLGPEDCQTFVMVDGAGHGPMANAAASRAIESISRGIKEDVARPLQRLMRECHVALAGTRGAAVALLRVEPRQGISSFCGVGNIASALLPKKHNSGISLPGTVGYRIPTVRVFDSPFVPGDVWWLWTDGLSSRMATERFHSEPTHVAARRALAEFGRREDDATVMVLRFATRAPISITPMTPVEPSGV